MIERDPHRIHSDENKPIEIAFSVSQGRVEHYTDVVDHLVNTEVAKCKAEGFNPSKQQIEFFRKEVIRYAVIRRDVEKATTLKMNRGSNVLNEANNRLPSRAKL